MHIPCNHQVAREYGVRVYLHIVASALAAFEFDVELLRRTVGRTQETRPCGDGGFINLCGSGANPARVMLRCAVEAAHIQGSRLRCLERAEVGGCERPDRKLVLDEFVEFVHCVG